MHALRWQALKTIVPIAPSLRREHWDLFSRLDLSENQRTDDEVFYDALLHTIRKDVGFLKDFEVRFGSAKKKKDREKSFLSRSQLWLQRDFPASDDESEEAAAEELRELVRQLRAALETDEARVASDAETLWVRARGEFMGTLQRIDSPSLEGIEAIAEAAGALLEVGAQWKKTELEVERQRAHVRRLLEDAGSQDEAGEILGRLGTLESSGVRRLYGHAEELGGQMKKLAEMADSSVEKEAAFDRLRRENASWAVVARQADELAALEEDRKDEKAAVSRVLSRMRAAIGDPGDSGEPGPPSGRRSPKRARAGEAPAGPSGAGDEVLEEIGSPAPEPPSGWNDLGAWCGVHLKDRLVLSPRAGNSIKKALYQDVGTAARCLLWLAGDYRRARLEGRGEGVQGPVPGLPGLHNERCGGDAFEFVWSGRRPIADWHIRSGGNSRDPARCLRIYYCWDEASSMVLVGDMPAHVRSRVT